MTFDEALEAVEVKVIDEIKFSFTVIRRCDESEIKAIIEELRDTYAPMIYMTSEQRALLEMGRIASFRNLHVFLDGVYNDAGHPLALIPADDLALAWLHPELIKVI